MCRRYREQELVGWSRMGLTSAWAETRGILLPYMVGSYLTATMVNGAAAAQ